MLFSASTNNYPSSVLYLQTVPGVWEDFEQLTSAGKNLLLQLDSGLAKMESIVKGLK